MIGQIIPWTMAFLGLSFIACALLIIGMPPLSGFIGKLSLISALFNPKVWVCRPISRCPPPPGAWWRC